MTVRCYHITLCFGIYYLIIWVICCLYFPAWCWLIPCLMLPVFPTRYWLISLPDVACIVLAWCWLISRPDVACIPCLMLTYFPAQCWLISLPEVASVALFPCLMLTYFCLMLTMLQWSGRTTYLGGNCWWVATCCITCHTWALTAPSFCTTTCLLSSLKSLCLLHY